MGDRHSASLKKPVHLTTVKLMHLIVLGRWLLVLCLWLTLGIYGLWGLRAEVPLWRDYLTWTSVRYGLIYNPEASLALFFCVGYTCAVLIWHSQKLLRGWSEREQYKLEKKAEKINQDSKHWLHRLLKKLDW